MNSIIVGLTCVFKLFTHLFVYLNVEHDPTVPSLEFVVSIHYIYYPT